MVLFLKCPYCNIEYNSFESFNAHIQGCFYKECPQSEQVVESVESIQAVESTQLEEVNFEALSYQELKEIALSKGMKAGNMKRVEIIKLLKEMED